MIEMILIDIKCLLLLLQCGLCRLINCIFLGAIFTLSPWLDTHEPRYQRILADFDFQRNRAPIDHVDMGLIHKVGKGTLLAKENTRSYLKCHLEALVGGTSFGLYR